MPTGARACRYISLALKSASRTQLSAVHRLIRYPEHAGTRIGGRQGNVGKNGANSSSVHPQTLRKEI